MQSPPPSQTSAADPPETVEDELESELELYLIDLLAAFLGPEVGQRIHGGVVVPCAVAELSMVLCLLGFGVRSIEAEAAPSVLAKGQLVHAVRTA